MGSKQGRWSWIGWIVLVCGQTAFAGTYTDPSGFSFTYPDGWITVTRAQVGEVNQVIPPEIRNWVNHSNIDLNRMAVVLLRNGQEEFLENINVVVDSQQIPLDDDSLQELNEKLPQQYRAAGATIEDFQARIQKVGSREAMVVEYRARMPGMPETLRQKQVMFPGGGKTYIVTYTATADSFERYRATFDNVLLSFQTPDPLSQGFDWNRVIMMALVGAVIGGLIGGVSWITKKLSKKAGPKQTRDETRDTDHL